ncbi:hypothetical protein J577_0320 [Acinetobacter sp. 263903-1]|nr:hypothetical protein J577_0320 [Acinetobacter sp. 263903-1]
MVYVALQVLLCPGLNLNFDQVIKKRKNQSPESYPELTKNII